MGCGPSAVARLRPPRPTSPHTHTASHSTQPQPQPRHGKEDMWSPQSDFSDDSTLSQTQNVRPIGWLAPTPTSPNIYLPTLPRPATPRVHAPRATASLRAWHRPTRVLRGRRLHALPRDTTRRRCAPAQRGGPPTRFPLPSIGKPEKYLAGHTPLAPHALTGDASISCRAPLPGLRRSLRRGDGSSRRARPPQPATLAPRARAP